MQAVRLRAGPAAGPPTRRTSAASRSSRAASWSRTWSRYSRGATRSTPRTSGTSKPRSCACGTRTPSTSAPTSRAARAPVRLHHRGARQEALQGQAQPPSSRPRTHGRAFRTRIEVQPSRRGLPRVLAAEHRPRERLLQRADGHRRRLDAPRVRDKDDCVRRERGRPVPARRDRHHRRAKQAVLKPHDAEGEPDSNLFRFGLPIMLAGAGTAHRFQGANAHGDHARRGQPAHVHRGPAAPS